MDAGKHYIKLFSPVPKFLGYILPGTSIFMTYEKKCARNCRFLKAQSLLLEPTTQYMSSAGLGSNLEFISTCFYRSHGKPWNATFSLWLIDRHSSIPSSSLLRFSGWSMSDCDVSRGNPCDELSQPMRRKLSRPPIDEWTTWAFKLCSLTHTWTLAHSAMTRWCCSIPQLTPRLLAIISRQHRPILRFVFHV